MTYENIITKSKKKEFNLDQGKLNVGFNLFEAIMESVDDAFDAACENNTLNEGNQVSIYIYKEKFKEQTDEGEVESDRYSYAILDNGPGTTVEGVFDFGKMKENRYPNKYALDNLNGVFHYGLVAHLNVANRLNFYSREINGDWWVNSLEYNVFSKKAMSYRGKETPAINENEFLYDLDNPDFNVRTLVHVRGVRKSVLGASNLEELEIKLKKRLGITYRYYLERGKQIFINGKEVLPLDPFMQEYNFEKIGVESNLIHSFEISLNELLKVEEDEIIRQLILNDFKHLYENEDELLNQCISVKMYHLDLGLRSGEKRRLAAQETNVLLPTSIDSGFYIKRNLRYIGTAAKILNICSGHNTFNYFRAEISFNPIFDIFFGIQINKNKYDIKSSLGALIIEKINAKVGNLYSYLDNLRKNGQGLTVNTVPIDVELKKHSEISRKRAIHLAKVLAEAIEIGVIGEVLDETEKAIETLYRMSEELLTTVVKIEEERALTEKLPEDIMEVVGFARSLISEVAKISQTADEVLTRLETAISTRNEVLVVSAMKLKERIIVALNSNRSIIHTEGAEMQNQFQGFILEPLNEVQLYGVLLILMHYFPSEFDFVLLDYCENDHLDCLVKIKKHELYKQLNLKERFENQWNEEWDNYLLEDVGGFSFVELKYMLGEKKELGHSLTLVSHLVCWDFSEKNIVEFEALDGKYRISKDRRYLLHEDKRKKVKIICIKDYLQGFLGEEISVSSEKFNLYLNG